MRTLLLVVCVALVGVYGYYLEEKKVVFLDRTPSDSGISNFLFRGNEPKISVNGSDVFAYDLLKQYLMNASVSQANFKLPDPFYLIDVKYVYSSLDPAEIKDIELEENFFKSNTKLGEYYTHVVWGDLYSPSMYHIPNNNGLVVDGVRYQNTTLKARSQALSQWQQDDLPGYIPTINQYLYLKRDLPTVIYLHCECGCDRTGEIGGAYALRYLNKSYSEVVAWDTSIAGRPILPNHQIAIEWYCYYLTIVEGMQLGCGQVV